MSRGGLLRRNRAYGNLWIARTLSMMGSAISATILVLYLGQVGVSPLRLGGVLLVLLLVRAMRPASLERFEARQETP